MKMTLDYDHDGKYQRGLRMEIGNGTGRTEM